MELGSVTLFVLIVVSPALHDGAQARLVAMGMSLGTIEALVEKDPARAKKLLARAREWMEIPVEVAVAPPRRVAAPVESAA